MNAVKHTVECHCVLPQYRDRKDPVYHKFVVFSELDAQADTVLPSYSQCNNCGTVHKVYDICKSEIIAGKDESATVEKLSDVAMSLPTNLVELFESYSLEVSDYMMARYILDNKVWDATIVLSKEQEDDKTNGKILRFLENGRFRVESFSRQEYFE
jgi:hypothetical protein